MAAGNTRWYTDAQLKKIIDRIEPQANGCWWYPALPNKTGYAATRIGWPVTKSEKIYRLSWTFYKGDIPEGMTIDHLCHDPKVCKEGNACLHRRCVNPDHLALVSQSDNSKKTSRMLSNMTHCVNGHSLENNIRIYKTNNQMRKVCKTCSQIQRRDSMRRTRAAKKVSA